MSTTSDVREQDAPATGTTLLDLANDAALVVA